MLQAPTIKAFQCYLKSHPATMLTTLKEKIGNIYQSCIEINKPSMLIFNQQILHTKIDDLFVSGFIHDHSLYNEYFLLSSYEIWESIGFTSGKSKKKMIFSRFRTYYT
jgi:hypothetical protein